jgi:hypothetical protein
MTQKLKTAVKNKGKKCFIVIIFKCLDYDLYDYDDLCDSYDRYDDDDGCLMGRYFHSVHSFFVGFGQGQAVPAGLFRHHCPNCDFLIWVIYMIMMIEKQSSLPLSKGVCREPQLLKGGISQPGGKAP